MESLKAYFHQVGFRDEVLEKVVKSFVLQTFEKSDLVVTEGRTSKHIGLVESALFQYFVNRDRVVITSYVSIGGTWLASVMSFVSEIPSRENIRALTNGAVYMISKTDLRKLVHGLPAFKDFYIALLGQSICGIDESRPDLIVLTADQRYEKLLIKDPHLLQQIPLQHLAAMLGITTRHLSRIRKNID